MKIPKLREWREARGLTQKELADEAGLSERSVAGYEAGGGVRPNTARKLASVLNVQVVDLLEESQAPKVESRSPLEPSFNHLLADEERRAAFADVLANLHARFASQTHNLPRPPRHDIERVRTEEALTQLLNAFFPAAKALDEHAVRDKELYSIVNAIGTQLLPKASEWLHEYGETAQLEEIDEQVEIWEEALQQRNETKR